MVWRNKELLAEALLKLLGEQRGAHPGRPDWGSAVSSGTTVPMCASHGQHCTLGQDGFPNRTTVAFDSSESRIMSYLRDCKKNPKPL